MASRTSRVTKEDAAEWLASLQQVGEGWYRQVALAIKADAHKALGMDRREFAQQIGQRMIDPQQAIIELHNEGHSQTAIAEILGVSQDRTVSRVLVAEGLVEPPPRLLTAPDGGDADADTAPDGGDADAVDVDAEVEQLHDEIEALTAAIKGEEKKRKEAVKKVKADLKKLKTERVEELRKARQEAEEDMTAEERERLRKENEAWAEEEGRKVIASLAGLGVQGVIGALEGATEQLKALVEPGGLTPELVAQIDAAFGEFSEELAVARVSAEQSVA